MNWVCIQRLRFTIIKVMVSERNSNFFMLQNDIQQYLIALMINLLSYNIIQYHVNIHIHITETKTLLQFHS